MTMEQFAQSMSTMEEKPSPLLQALQALRSCELDEIRDSSGLFCDWIPWGDDTPAQTPQIYVKRPELRC